jgi:hypothetical protein
MFPILFILTDITRLLQHSIQRLPRGSYAVTFPAAESTGDFECYVEAKDGRTTLKFPATAPQRNQSVMVMKE